ncbi:P-loop containing nucleoside triphosphate hydrolase protein [Absidia repens]|uniref:RNA helicase n=1 Tax=Absidia repens TaxID=90262 RepID=A0A1X2I6M0_9FUNG|nr:P-loop containing nucleoside triphosphate hydrolase protein [Absidia repens]
MLLNKTLINTRSYTTFQKLGIPETVANHLKTNFGIKQATQAQSKFIPAILSGKDLFLRDATGTGKSFGIALTLASQPSCRTLYITPNQELATQINQWIQSLTSSNHIIVDTPAKLLRRIADQSQQHEFNNLGRIVLDEADQALRLPKRYATLRQQQHRQQHPKPAQLIMTSLFSPTSRFLHGDKRQLIVSSATLNRSLRHWMTQQGWLQDPLFIDITKGNQIPHHTTTDLQSTLEPRDTTNQLAAPVQHYCLMVSDDAIRNMTPPSNDAIKYSSLMESAATTPRSTTFDDDDDRMLESIAILHDLESLVLQNSVLFVDTSVSIADIQARLASYDIQARDIREAMTMTASSSPPSTTRTLWIATEFTARGVDLPHISHVFILGKPSSIASYIHMAGRTGRLNANGNISRGKVISLVRDHGKSEAKMMNMYNLMNIPIRSLEHVE